MTLDEVTLENIDVLEQLEPTGCGNPEALFLLRGAQVDSMRPCGAEGTHLQMTLQQGETIRSAIAFHKGELARDGLLYVDAVFEPGRNEYRGRVTPQLRVQTLVRAGGTVQLPDEISLTRALLQEITNPPSNSI